MERTAAKPSDEMRNLCMAAEAMRISIVESLSEPARQQIADSIGAGDVIAASIRVDHDFVTGLPTVVFELIDVHGGRHHVQTRNIVSPPPKDS